MKMATANNSESEIKTWLTLILKKDNLTDLSVNVLGTSEKGDGYLGDIVFVDAAGIVTDGSTKKYNLVLKCSKRSLILRQSTPVKDIFANEIFVYDKLLPRLQRFQELKGIENPFNSIPKCYGTFIGDNMEVIALENLKSRGFELWPRKLPLTRKHIDLVINEYGKLHATSVAMQDHQPVDFQNCVDILQRNMEPLSKRDSMQNIFESCIDQVYQVLKNDLDEHILLKWKNFKEQVAVTSTHLETFNGLKVILHGDCWSNNFMYKYDNEKKIPSEVVILDCQIVRYNSPVFDLSYFLFTCISKENIDDLEDILKNYYKVFASQLTKLGAGDSSVIYPLNQFLDDWKNYSNYGIMLASLLMKVCLSDKDEVVDIAENAEKGKEFGETFRTAIKDTASLRNRMRHIVEYAAKHDLI